MSRVGHKNDEVYALLSTLIVTVMQQYPKQALWLFTSVVKSTKKNREQRGRQILDRLRVGEIPIISVTVSWANISVRIIPEMPKVKSQAS